MFLENYLNFLENYWSFLEYFDIFLEIFLVVLIPDVSEDFWKLHYTIHMLQLLLNYCLKIIKILHFFISLQSMSFKNPKSNQIKKN